MTKPDTSIGSIYSDVTFAKDLRFDTNPRLEAAWLEDWDKHVIKLAPSDALSDTYGYFAMWFLGFAMGAITILCFGR